MDHMDRMGTNETIEEYEERFIKTLTTLIDEDVCITKKRKYEEDMTDKKTKTKTTNEGSIFQCFKKQRKDIKEEDILPENTLNKLCVKRKLELEEFCDTKKIKAN